ncbi:hypothetical protein ER45_028060 (plasmid) [Bacillus mycoides]|nr:hypothetical protein ER45_028060 [Bacillus mycoides]
MIKKEGGMMVEEHVLDIYNFLDMTDWQDIVSFLELIFCLKIVTLYIEKQGVFSSSTSSSNWRREPLLSYININDKELPLITCFMLHFITKIVQKKEDEEEDNNLTCCIAQCFIG